MTDEDLQTLLMYAPMEHRAMVGEAAMRLRHAQASLTRTAAQERSNFVGPGATDEARRVLGVAENELQRVIDEAITVAKEQAEKPAATYEGAAAGSDETNAPASSTTGSAPTGDAGATAGSSAVDPPLQADRQRDHPDELARSIARQDGESDR